MKPNRTLSLTALVAALSMTAGHAANLTINDPSFELTANTVYDGGAYSLDSGNLGSEVEYTDGNSGTAGVANPTSAQFPNDTGPGYNPNANNPLPAPADGYNALYINAAAGATNTAIYTGTIGDYVAGDTYDLTVAIGDAIGSNTGGSYTLSLLAGGNVIDSTAATKAGTAGTFTDLSLPYLATAAVNGDSIGFELTLTGKSSGGLVQGFYDDVTLTQAAPEPSSVALVIVAGAAGLMVPLIRRRQA